MATQNLSLFRFPRRTPQPPIRTPRGNFRYSVWTAQSYTIDNNGEIALDVPAAVDGVRLFLFGQDNIARGVAHVPTTGALYTPQVLTAVSAYSVASTLIVPGSVASNGQSVYATINGVAGVRGVLAEQPLTLGTGPSVPTVAPIVDVSFDSGVIAGYSNFLQKASPDVEFRPVLLDAAFFTQAIVDNGYIFTDASGDRVVVVGVYEFYAD